MEALLISACLMGFDCKYSGGNNRLSQAQLDALRARYRLIPVCPEVSGGLPVPRAASERVGARVMSCAGRDVTAEYMRGAQTALTLAERFSCDKALLKAASPSCGSGEIYDGTFSGRLVPGDGTAAECLRARGVALFSEKELDSLI